MYCKSIHTFYKCLQAFYFGPHKDENVKWSWICGKVNYFSVGRVLEGEDCALWNVQVYFTNKYHRFPTSSDWGHIRPYKVIKGLTTYCYYSSEEPSPDQMQYSRTSNKDKMLNACIVSSAPVVNESTVLCILWIS